MKTEHFAIDRTPAVLYGAPTDRAYLFLHGQLGCKEEAEAFAQVVCPKGYQVLSVDLPGHGARQGREEALVPWTAAEEIRAAVRWAQGRWPSLSLRANSIGAYFAMLAVDAPDRALLVSPVLDMERLILDRMDRAGVTEEQLRERGEIAAAGETLSWAYLCWVREHPVKGWSCPVHILYGSRDDMIPRQTVEAYARRPQVHLTVAEGGEHWFHTAGQLAALRAWEEAAVPEFTPRR